VEEGAHVVLFYVFLHHTIIFPCGYCRWL